MDKDVLGGLSLMLQIRDRFEDYPCAPLPDDTSC